MKRLTEVDGKGNWHIAGVEWGNCKGNLYGALCKLKDYEDTGLSPAEVERLNTFDGSQAVKATVLLQEEQRKHSWITISERMPEDKEHVLVADRDGCVEVAYHSAEGWHLAFTGFIYVRDPLAWMPLPEPYRA